MPAGWELGIGDDANKGIPYFFNTETSQSVWNHPREAVFMRKVKEEKEKDKQRKAKKEAQDSKAGKPTPKKPEKKDDDEEDDALPIPDEDVNFTVRTEYTRNYQKVRRCTDRTYHFYSLMRSYSQS